MKVGNEIKSSEVSELLLWPSEGRMEEAAMRQRARVSFGSWKSLMERLKGLRFVRNRGVYTKAPS